MLSAVLDWVHSRLQEYAPNVLGGIETPPQVSRNDGSESDDLPPSVALPAHRAHQLEHCYPSQTVPNGSFFHRLPADLRRLILIEAFGDRILHVDLQHGYEPRPVHVPFSLASCYLYRVRPPPRRGDLTWRWAGCVCHRDPEWRVRRRRFGENSVSEPRKDGCLWGVLWCQACDHWPGRKPLKCRVGAMGWLRVSRQAYIEGIEVLYGTNRFHFSGTTLLKNLSHLMRPEHLTLVKSAEMIWDLGRVARPPSAFATDQGILDDPRFGGWYKFTALLQAIPAALPNLRYLHVTIAGTWYPSQMAPNDLARRSEEDILQPLDEFARVLFSAAGRQLEELNVALPSRVFLTRLITDRKTTTKYEESREFRDVSDRIWRSLRPVDGDSGDLGYWLREGIDDGDPDQTRGSGL